MNRRLLIAAAAVLIVFLVAVALWSGGGGSEQKSGRANLAPNEVLLMDVLGFRQRVLDDSRAALIESATPSGQAALQALGQELSANVAPETAWGLLTQTSLMMIGATGGDQAMSAFYNPWSDVFLLLEWSRQKERWLISDAELVMGDWLRMVGKAPVNPQPIWLRGNERRSGALALAVADASRTFDALFPAGASAAGWRELLGVAQPEPGQKLNRGLASLSVDAVVLNVADYLAPAESASPRLLGLRRSVEQAVAAMAAGKMADVLASASETEPNQREVLLKVDPASLSGLTPIFFIPANVGGNGDGSGGANDVDTLFLLPTKQLDFCLSLRFSGNPASLRQITLVPFAAVVEAAQKRAGGAK